MQLDFSTMTFTAGMASLLAAVCLGLLAAGHREEPALWRFVAGAVMGAIGLFAFWAMEPPRPVGPRIAANLLLIADHAALLIGFRCLFEYRRDLSGPSAGVLLGTGLAFGTAWVGGDPFIGRIWIYSLAAFALSIAIAWTLLARPSRYRPFERWAGARLTLGSLFAVHGAFQLARAGLVSVAPDEAVTNWRDPSPLHTLSMLDGVLLAGAVIWGVASLHGQKLARALDRLAREDPLTRLPNRLAFEELFRAAAEGARRRGTPFALAVIDVDGFKWINDRFGHVQGDQFLESVTRSLAEGLRAHDTVARFGGDELLVLMDGVDRSAGEAILLRLVTAAPPVRLGDEAVTPSFSFGVSAHPEDGIDFDTLYRSADARMYEAKRRTATGPTIAHADAR